MNNGESQPQEHKVHLGLVIVLIAIGAIAVTPIIYGIYEFFSSPR